MKWLFPLVFITSCSSGGPMEQYGPANEWKLTHLKTCGEMVCQGSAQRIDGGTPFAMYNMACVVEALRDRMAGTYGVTLNHTSGKDSENVDLYLRVLSTGNVMIGGYRTHLIDGQVSEESWEPVRHCWLATPDVFNTCLTAIQMGQGPDATPEAWDCVFPESAVSTLALPWLTMCIEADPICK